jgi:hypothetical protein
MKVPVFIMEEHHEAFLVWDFARRTGQIAGPCLLMHYDDHADMRAPELNRSVKEIALKEAAYVRELVDEDLAIDNFIVPAIYAGFINGLYWIKRDRSNASRMNLTLRSFNQEGMKFICQRDDGSERTADARTFSYFKGRNAHVFTDPPEADVKKLLDIDLDYFSCCEQPSRQTVVAITREEFEEFSAGAYHPLKYITSRVEAVRYGDGYYYLFNKSSFSYESTRRLDAEAIQELINELVSGLRHNSIRPELITICRSRFSGFTPEDQWEMIESQLISGLSTLYDLDLHSINELGPAIDHTFEPAGYAKSL